MCSVRLDPVSFRWVELSWDFYSLHGVGVVKCRVQQSFNFCLSPSRRLCVPCCCSATSPSRRLQHAAPPTHGTYRQLYTSKAWYEQSYNPAANFQSHPWLPWRRRGQSKLRMTSDAPKSSSHYRRDKDGYRHVRDACTVCWSRCRSKISF